MSQETGGARSRLAQLGLTLPPPPEPIASYVPFALAGNLIVTSGVLPVRQGRVISGRLGADLGVAAGAEAARLAALSLLAVLARAAGDLDRVRSLVQLTGYVRSADGFSRQSEVVDGASELLLQVLGEAGRHARVSVGVAELPRDACVELQLTALR